MSIPDPHSPDPRPANEARPALAHEPPLRAATPPRTPTFDYSSIPVGHYDRVLREGSAIRRLWHLSKFERVLDYLPQRPGQRLLDIGCFAGTFLSMADPARFSRQLGVDILPAQIEYANRSYGSPARRFVSLHSIVDLGAIEERFDCITLIEVIEHLSRTEIHDLLSHAARLLEPGGHLVLTTPNYASTWPILERILNRVGDVSYAEQHITRFTFFDLKRRLVDIYPAFDATFRLDLKTTTHFVTPFLAALSFRMAQRLSRVVPHASWRLPFGNLILAGLVRR